MLNKQTIKFLFIIICLIQTFYIFHFRSGFKYEILKKPDVAGYFCLSTSYRMEPNPVPGRHDIIFPMFEFEFKGDMDELVELQKE